MLAYPAGTGGARQSPTGSKIAHAKKANEKMAQMVKQLTVEEIRAAVDALRAETQEFLCDLMRFPSTPGQEAEAMEYIASRFAEFAEVECIALSNTLRDDENFADPIPGIEYDERMNVRVRIPGSGGGKSLLFNTHIDVVPPSQGQLDPWDPQVDNGCIRGRGACDAKGQAAAIFMAFSALQRLGVQFPVISSPTWWWKKRSAATARWPWCDAASRPMPASCWSRPTRVSSLRCAGPSGSGSSVTGAPGTAGKRGSTSAR